MNKKIEQSELSQTAKCVRAYQILSTKMKAPELPTSKNEDVSAHRRENGKTKRWSTSDPEQLLNKDIKLNCTHRSCHSYLYYCYIKCILCCLNTCQFYIYGCRFMLFCKIASYCSNFVVLA